jgi:mRNA interferase MazF
LSPTVGREQAGGRPVLVLSVDAFNAGPAELVIVAPLSTRIRAIPSHIRVEPPDGGLDRPSVVLCEAVRSISRHRFRTRLGVVAPGTLGDVGRVLRILLDF